MLALDAKTDIAVLKLDDSGRVFPFLPFGDSDQVRPGDWVIAVGAPYGLAATVSAGVITATPSPASPSPFRSLLQTDAVAGHGTAGAPVVNLNGEIVGMSTQFGGEDIGYAVPSRVVRRVYLELLEKGRVSRPWLGVTPQSLTVDLVAVAAPDGPAARAGLRSGDVILQIDAVAVSSPAQLERAVSALPPGHAATLTLRRVARVVRVAVVLGEEPDPWRLDPALARSERLLGLEVRATTPTMGVTTGWIDPGGPAEAVGEAVGIETGDVIREVDRRPIRNVADFQAVARTLRPGSEVLLLLQRGAPALYVVVTARE